MATIASNIINIMRDLVNNKQLEVSFSYAYKPQHKFNEESEKYDGPLYLKKNTRFVSDVTDESQVLFFLNAPDFITFLNELRIAIDNGDMDIFNDLREFKDSIIKKNN